MIAVVLQHSNDSSHNETDLVQVIADFVRISQEKSHNITGPFQCLVRHSVRADDRNAICVCVLSIVTVFCYESQMSWNSCYLVTHVII